MADDPAATTNGGAPKVELDAEGTRLALEEKKAQFRKGIAEARKAAVGAEFPALKTKAPEGKVDVGENVGLVGQLVACELLEDAADLVSNAFPNTGRRRARVLIVNDRALLATDWTYHLFAAQLDHQIAALTGALGQWSHHKTIIDLHERASNDDTVLLIDALREQRKKEQALPEAEADGAEHHAAMNVLGPAALALAPLVIDSVASIVSLFRARYSFTSRAVTIGESPLVAEVAKKLMENRDVTIDGFELLRTGIFHKFLATHRLRSKLAAAVLEAKASHIDPADKQIAAKRAVIGRLETRIAKAIEDSKPDGAIDGLEKRIEKLEQEIEDIEKADLVDRARVATADEVLAAFDAFSTAALDGDTPALAAAALHERLDSSDRSGQGYTHVVFVDLEGAGAEALTKEQAVKSGEIAFIGGAEVSWLILDVAQNKLVAAGAEPLLGSIKYQLNENTLTKLHRCTFER